MKADEISRLMGENEKLKADVDAYKVKCCTSQARTNLGTPQLALSPCIA